MNCNDALKLLSLMDENRGKRISLNEHDQLTLQELEQNAYVSRIKLEDFDLHELSQARSELIQLQNMAKNLNGLEPAALDEQVLRNRIIVLSELSANKQRSISIHGIDYGITYKGKELIENLIPRLKRIGNKQVKEFAQEMTALNDTFFSWAKRSFEILEYLSPMIPAVDEIHCRSVVIGLSSRPENAKEVTEAFVFTLETIGDLLKDHDRLPFIAECIIISLENLSKEKISSAVSKFNDIRVLAGKYSSNYDAAIDCALLLYPLDHSATENMRFLGYALDFARKIDPEIKFDIRLEAALLIEIMGIELNEEMARKFQEYYDKIDTPGIPDRNSGIAAALIVIGIFEGQQVYSRFTTALEYLDRFSDEPMVIPAAMLLHLSPEIEETLDTLRLASSVIARQKLSLGGIESLSLGMKMLLQSSVISSMISIPAELRNQYVSSREIIPLQTLGILSISMLPVALIAFTTFHELSIHKITFTDYSFHPVHTNFAYG